MKSRDAVILPGSYDPVTLGHLDMIRRAAEQYEEVYAVIFTNPDKTYTFSLEDRVKMLILATDELDNVLVSYSNGLVIDYMREHNIKKIIKGYRNECDLEYERKMAKWNLEHGGYDTDLVPASPELVNISSTEARRLIAEGADLGEILPKKVIDFIARH
jgi:pantetheine-phosphate adenylyltransferase